MAHGITFAAVSIIIITPLMKKQTKIKEPFITLAGGLRIAV